MASSLLTKLIACGIVRDLDRGKRFFFRRTSRLIILIGVASSLLTFASPDLPEKENFHIYLAIGGLNMAGRATTESTSETIIRRCFLLNEKGEWEPAKGPLNRYSSIRKEGAQQGVSPVNSFVEAMLDKDKTINIGIIVNAGEGTDSYIEHWRYKDQKYRAARKRIKQARKHGVLKGVLWHQDSHRIDSSLSYLKDLIGNTRADQAILNLPFVVGGTAGKLPNAYDSRYHALIRDVHALGYAKGHDLSLEGKSFDLKSVKTLGFRYAQEMMRIQNEWDEKEKTFSKVPRFRVIDVHTHAQETRVNGLDIVDQWMNLAGVERCISMPLAPSRPKNDEERKIMLENFRKYKGRIDRFCIIEPEEVSSVEEAVRILRKEKAEGAIGFGEHYGRERMFDDPANLRLFEACQQVGLPVLFHIDGNKSMDQKGLPHLERALKLFPKCIFIAHAEFWLELSNGTCDRLLQNYPNLYADPSGIRMVSVLNRDRRYSREFLIRNQDQIMFGSDAGWWSFGKQRSEREMQFSLFEQLELPDEVLKKIYHENAEKLFGFTSKPE